MCKAVLIGLVVALIVLMVVSAVVVQEYGWTGFLIMLGVLVVLVFVAKKLLPRFFGYMLTRPLRQLGKALEGSRLVVHSITPAEPPPPDEFGDHGDGPPHLEDDDDYYDDDDAGDDPAPVDVGPLDWYCVEFSVIPRDAGSCEGRMVNRQGWEPEMIQAIVRRANSDRRPNLFRGWPPADWSDFSAIQQGGVEIWDGNEYVLPGEVVFGEQRLQMRFGVARHVTAVVIVYTQFTEVGTIQIPRINVRPEAAS